MATAPGAAQSSAQQALSTLRPLQPILAGFNHRNKNQHRGARWWSSFGMLHRHLHKFAAELEVASQRTATSSKKRKREDAGSGGGGGGSTGMKDGGPAEMRARWMRDVLVPGCYVAFSQLAADNQWATLGIVLLGVLAQANAACVLIVGEAGEAGTPSQETAVAAKEPEPAIRKGSTFHDVADLGQVVSRDEIIAAPSGKSQGHPERPPVKRTTYGVDEAPEGRTAEVKGLHAMVAGQKEKPPTKTEKKRKKRKKGDEFDDLFSSLL
ncbi:hypothetical protein BJ170DRAFT_732369 [Xylariales sp. AK1849]|nr:hypothetical protein BJ170DRAFT_732369 [Xylariales sp. AK1849]